MIREPVVMPARDSSAALVATLLVDGWVPVQLRRGDSCGQTRRVPERSPQPAPAPCGDRQYALLPSAAPCSEYVAASIPRHHDVEYFEATSFVVLQRP